MVTCISAVTLATRDMRRAVGFYRLLDMPLTHGGEEAAFTSFRAGANFLNLILQPANHPGGPLRASRLRRRPWWGRLILYHADIDALYARLVAAGCRPEGAPRDAQWGERFFHVIDPDGHELSFAWPLEGPSDAPPAGHRSSHQPDNG